MPNINCPALPCHSLDLEHTSGLHAHTQPDLDIYEVDMAQPDVFFVDELPGDELYEVDMAQMDVFLVDELPAGRCYEVDVAQLDIVLVNEPSESGDYAILTSASKPLPVTLFYRPDGSFLRMDEQMNLLRPVPTRTPNPTNGRRRAAF